MSGFICAILISTNLAGAYFPSNDPVLGEGGFRGKDLGQRGGEERSIAPAPQVGTAGAGAGARRGLEAPNEISGSEKNLSAGKPTNILALDCPTLFCFGTC